MSRAGFALALLDLILLAWWRTRTSGRTAALRARVREMNGHARLANGQCAELKSANGRLGAELAVMAAGLRADRERTERCGELEAEVAWMAETNRDVLADRQRWINRCCELETTLTDLAALAESSPVRGPGGRFAKKAAT